METDSPRTRLRTRAARAGTRGRRVGAARASRAGQSRARRRSARTESSRKRSTPRSALRRPRTRSRRGARPNGAARSCDAASVGIKAERTVVELASHGSQHGTDCPELASEEKTDHIDVVRAEIERRAATGRPPTLPAGHRSLGHRLLEGRLERDDATQLPARQATPRLDHRRVEPPVESDGHHRSTEARASEPIASGSEMPTGFSRYRCFPAAGSRERARRASREGVATPTASTSVQPIEVSRRFQLRRMRREPRGGDTGVVRRIRDRGDLHARDPASVRR